MTASDLVLWFSAIGEGDAALVGGKAHSLGALTRAGFSVPAGVIIIGSTIFNRSAARITATYPARFACELSASIFCARVERGIISIEMALTPADTSASCTSKALKGSR